MNINVPQQIINAIWLGSVYSLFALGYAVVFSVLGVLNLAHSAIFMWGAVIGWYVITQLGLPVPLAFVIAMVGAGLLSVLLERVAFLPLRRRNAPRISQLISSIGVSIVLVSLAEATMQNIISDQIGYFPRGLIPNKPIALESLPFRVTPIQIIIFVAAIALVIILQFVVSNTRVGQAMRAVAFNQRTASLLGINVGGVFVTTFFLAGAMAGAAGVLYGLAYGSVEPQMGNKIALLGLTAMVLGGLGSIRGAVLGGFVVAALQVFSTALGGSDYRDAVVFTILFLILIVRPQGLIGTVNPNRA
jgi:branched-chain amino acid transport system permease protein